MISAFTTQNDRADQLFSQGDYSSALEQYQQVFLNGAKSYEVAVRTQVARSLRGAALCYEKLGQTRLATEILNKLATHFGGDQDANTRYWVEQAQSTSTRLHVETRETQAASEVETTCLKPSWEDFLKTNNLESPSRLQTSSEGEVDCQDTQDTSDSPPHHAVHPSTPTPAFAAQSTPEEFSTEKSAFAPVIPENEISLERLQHVFENAYLECENDGESLRVQMEGARFLLHLDRKNKLIACAAIYAFKANRTSEAKHELANTLNRELILLRFVVHDETTFAAQYALSYARGLMPFHLINALRLMHRVLTQSVGEYDVNDLLR